MALLHLPDLADDMLDSAIASCNAGDDAPPNRFVGIVKEIQLEGFGACS